MSSNVKVLKLTSGEELVADVTENELEYTYTLKNVIALVPQQDPQTGKFGIAIIPWGQSVEGDITLAEHSVMYIADPKAELVAQYNSIFSGLVLPKPTLVV